MIGKPVRLSLGKGAFDAIPLVEDVVCGELVAWQEFAEHPIDESGRRTPVHLTVFFDSVLEEDRP